MNKRFSTLMAAVLVAGSMAANAERFDGPYEFRAMDVRTGITQYDATINHIEADKWYQLRTSSSQYDQGYISRDECSCGYGLLVHYRDLETGKVYLRVEDETSAPLVNSLWRIEYTKNDGVGGGKYRFINKETNVALMFDQTFANTTEETFQNSSLMVDGCVNEWEWYNNNSQISDFSEQAPYAYFANQDSVMIMRLDWGGFVSSYKDKASKLLNNHNVSHYSRALRFQPVVASEIELSARDFNSMIDYNKPSWNHQGEFAFYEPNGNLLDTVRMRPKGDAMKKGMMYYAEDAGYKQCDFYSYFIEQEGGIANWEEYNQLASLYYRAWEDHESARLIAESASSDLTNKELAVYNKKMVVAAFQSLVDQNQLLYDAAEMAALNMANQVLSFFTANIGVLDAIAIQSESYTTFKRMYDSAVSVFQNKKTISSALDLFNAGSALLNYGYVVRNDNLLPVLDGLKNTYGLLYNNYGGFEDSIALYESYLAMLNSSKNELLDAQNALIQAQEVYDSAANNLKIKEQEMNTAYDNMYAASDAMRKMEYLQKHRFVRLKYMNDNKDTYLMVDTAFWQDKTVPSSTQLVLSHKTPQPYDSKAIETRYYYTLTYYPTQDSLVMEPLNASKISDFEYLVGVNWIDSYAGTHLIYSNDLSEKASQASNSWTNGNEIAVKLEYLNTSNWCLTAAVANRYEDSPLMTRLAFNNPYGYLTRTTLAEGLYFIKSTNRGRYLVDNFQGRLMYDVPEKDIQDYNQMPATMWVVEKMGCKGGDLIAIRNREFGKCWNPIFEGQLYVDEDGNMFTVDNSYGPYYCSCGNYLTDDSRLTNNKLYMPDDYEFIPVTDETALTSEHHGYGFMDPETLNYTNYALRYNHNGREEFLNVDADGLLKVTKGAKDYYELDVHYAYDNQCGCDFMPAVEFGYGAGIVDANSGKTLQQLVRQRYTLKLKDVNLIDNDTTYVAMNRTLGANGYYITKGIKEIRRGGATLSSFYLKNDQIYGDSTCYALIDTRVTNCSELWDGYRRASVIDGNGHLEYNDLNNGPNTPVSAFALEINDRPLYRSIPETSVNFFRTIGTINQKLFHDATNETGASAVIEGFGYLGLAQEDMAANDDMKNIFVEPLRGYNYRMPQYMLAIERDTVADGLWCNTNTHGYFADLEDAEASKEDVSHVVFYNGYTAGRFLVNLQDSVTVGSHAYHKPDLFTYNGYAVRLGFIEGVHMVITEENATQINKFLGKKTVKAGEFFYVPINGKTLADLKNEQGYLIPGKLFDPENTKRNEYTSGKHNSWSFSFRLIDDANPDEFLIESYLAPYSSIGSWMGSWIKMYGRCPVVNYIDGEHGSIEGYGLRYDNVTDGEVFKLTPTSEGPGVANEDVTVSSVLVIAKEGAVSIIGAGSKKVKITNVLGQSITTRTLSSDNVTISAPAGVVVVSVEGEAAVKAIVK